MSVKKVYRKRLKAHVWAYDIWLNGRRIRDSGFATKKEAEEVVASLRLAARADRYGKAQQSNTERALRITDGLPRRAKPERGRRVTWLQCDHCGREIPFTRERGAYCGRCKLWVREGVKQEERETEGDGGAGKLLRAAQIGLAESTKG